MREGKYISVIIAAAGQGKRMGSKINKQYLNLSHQPILAHTLKVFEGIQEIDEMIIVVHPDEMKYCQEKIIEKYGIKKVSKIVPGGKERQESIFNGLKGVDPRCDIVVIHDGARPFVRKEHIIKSIDEVTLHKAVGLGVPVKDTIKIVDEENTIMNTPKRKFLWAIHTPQTFDYRLLIDAHKKALKDGFLGTDDTVLVERMNQKVKMMMGSYENIKITTPEDIYIGEAILKNREGEDM